MFYRKINDIYEVSESPILPYNKGQITKENQSNDEGWVWHDTPPVEYTDWLASQESTYSRVPGDNVENLECGYYKKYYQKYVFIYSTEDNDEELRADGYKWYELAPEEYKNWLEIEKK